jgi:hypothetical protein
MHAGMRADGGDDGGGGGVPAYMKPQMSPEHIDRAATSSEIGCLADSC